MPLNKNAYLRYLVIDACLRDNKKYSRDQILNKIEEKTGFRISIAMFEKDISAMREMPEPFNYAPIKYKRGDNYYYYDDPLYSFSRISLKDEELEAIEMAAAILSQYVQLPFMKQFVDAVQGIKQSIKSKRYLEGNAEAGHILLQKAFKTKGTEYLQVLNDAILERRVVMLKYKTFYSEKEQTFHVHPYLLHEHQNRWYLVGLCDEMNEIRTFGLDRIKDLEIHKGKTFISMGFDAKEHYRYALGIVAPAKGKPQKIKIRLSSKLGKYLLTQPMHETQVLLKEIKEYMDFSFTLYLTYELESKILSWGDEVEVIGPKALREKIRWMLKQALEKYN